jgi:two-component system, sensor histidine kinase PdtaS
MQKSIKIFSHVQFVIRTLFIINILFPLYAFTQLTKVDFKSQVLLMQLGAGYLNVARQNQIDLDSGLQLAASRNHLNPMFVIGENDEDIIRDPENPWIAREDIEGAKQQASATPGPKRIQLLNLIGAYYVFQSGSKKNDLDSALRYLLIAEKEAESSGDVKSQCQSLSYLGKYYLELEDLPLATTTFNHAINLSIRSGDKLSQAMALTYWAAYSPFQPATILERIDHLRKAEVLYQQTGEGEKQILVLTDIGYLSFAAGKMAESKQAFSDALTLEKKIGFPFIQYSLDLLALISTAQGDHEAQLRYAINMINAAEITRDSAALGYFYSRRYEADLDFNENVKEGLEWNIKAVNEFIRLGGDPALYTAMIPLASQWIAAGKEKETIQLLRNILNKFPPISPIDRQNAFIVLGRAYKGLKDFPKAEKYLLASESLQKETEKIRGTIRGFSVYNEIAIFYFDIHEYKKSQQFYKTAMTYPHNTEDFHGYTGMLYNLAKIDSINGNFENGFNHLMAYNNFHDSVMRKLATRDVAEMRERFESDKKDNNIKILNQQSQIQQIELKRDQLTRNVTIAGAAVLLLFLCYLYYQFRSKQKTNRKLEHLVDEKEFLLKEIHHRVKNNLQIVISLLNTQSKFLNNEEAIAAISESRHRMQAMSLIHQKLYQSDNVASVAMPDYIRELIEYLRNSSISGNRIHFELNIDPIDLDISQAIPVGLILNEAVTNCIKHAFDSQAGSRIKIEMKKKENNDIYLEIADNGRGLSAEQNNSFSQSMGMRLIRGLIEQLGGKLTIRNDNGLVLSTSFQQDLILKSVAV